MNKHLTKMFSALLILMLVLPVLPMQNVQAVSSEIVISQIYGGGGNSGATYTHDFIELFNRGTSSVSLAGWSVQYASATGTGNFGSSTTSITPLSGTLAPGQYLLVQEAQGSGGTTPLPTPDVTDSSPIAMSATGGKVALVNTTTPLGCNGGSTPCSAAALATIVDLVGWDGANFYETSPAPATTNTTAISRNDNGCAETDNNAADFTAGNPNPRNTASPLNPCSSVAEPKINEFVFNHTGTDTNEYVEVLGTPSTDYSAYSLVQIEGDFSGTAVGVVDSVTPVGMTDSGGFWQTGFLNNTFENGTVTLLLVKNFSGASGNDLDTNDDGTLDATPWDAIADTVAVYDGGATDATYGAPVLSANYDGLSFTPGGASRIPDGFDTESASDWIRNDFDLAGIPGFPGSITLGEAYNTPGAANEKFVPPPEMCGDLFTPIYDVQGSGAASPLAGSEVAIEGVVVGDFQNNASVDSGNLNGFHVQDPAGDGDASTSDGVFVYAPGGMDVAVGDAVRVRGSVSEFNGMTEITAAQIWVCSTGNSVAPTELSLPVMSVDDLEAFEGMYVTFPQELVISEYFNFDRFGEIVLTSRRHLTPTAEFEPGSPEQQQAALDYLLDRITLDDGRTASNPNPAIHPNGSVFDLTNLFRGGDTVANVTGVMDYSFGLYRIQPTQGADYTSVNPRTAAPEPVGGNLKVASFNVLNYFTTIDTGAFICGPAGDQECRGADNATEFTRQRTKIVSALSTINADVVGLLEIENHPANVPVADLVSGLNDVLGAGTYDYVATGAIGTDAIRVALIYKPATVTPQGAYAILDTSVDPRFNDDKNRPTLAQTFMDNSTGGVFTVAVNHLKSKGSDCNDVGDPDLGDGAGNCNLTRKAAAQALVDWLASDPTGSGDADFLIIGDLNSYDKEDPIDAIRAGADDVLGTDDDYTDMAYYLLGEDAYSYVFDGQTGYLDYALASSSLVAQITGVTDWHINADEPDLIDYDTSFKQPAQDAIYAPDAYRSSDHDPVIVGLSLLHYDFTGFFKPIENPPAVNSDKAGNSIPVKFSLDGDQGLDIFFGSYPKSVQMSCDFTSALGVAQTETAGGSSLTYDPLFDQYVYVWKTDKAWGDTCRQLVVVLKDGSVHIANFQFK